METTDTSAPLYSPRQIFWSTFFGGPLALTYLLSRNFAQQGKQDDARRYLLVGVLLCLLIAVLLTFLPGKLSVGVFIGCAVAGQHLARDKHFGGAKVPPEGARIYSAWRAFFCATAAFLVWLAAVVVLVLVLDAAGFKIPT